MKFNIKFSRIHYFIALFLYWIAIFVGLKIIFLVFHNNFSFELKWSTWFLIIWHGLPLDLSVIGYIMIFPLFIIYITLFIRKQFLHYILSTYTIILITVVLIIHTIDLFLFKYWGSRIDASILKYLENPHEMLASFQWYYYFLAIAVLSLLIYFIYKLYQKYVNQLLVVSTKSSIYSIVLLIVFLPFLFLSMRGGIDIAPISISRVYFHSNAFANQAAINAVWNTGFSISEKEGEEKYFNLLDKEYAISLFQEIMNGNDSTVSVLNNNRPNVILLIIESLTSKLIEPLGGEAGVTPNFNKLSQQGIFFTNFYANDSRSDKAMVNILSGYPTQGSTSIIKHPDKTNNIPHLAKCFNNKGYYTAYYYGGDIDFANFRSYLVNANFNKIISKSDFKRKDIQSNWGVPDHILFDYLYDDIKKSTQPFFKVLFTLSNHEPFDIPEKPNFKGIGTETKMYNAAYYTDKCIGEFVQKIKEDSIWNNTLIIITADHGHVYPGNSMVHEFNKYSIPMLWIGGVVNKDTIISKYGSQIDLASTLLNQLNIKNNEFIFSKNLLSPNTNSFAQYAYNNGFGFVTDSCRFVYDNGHQMVVVGEPPKNIKSMHIGKAIQQIQYYDYLSR